ncbi:chemotaxis protein CheW [Clostridium beijerinckii]|uniref:chemotaxis protein CheW n=1 Tax=Clostridium beijerinckii TaxID=1520 RepID=UPI001FA8E011|nr:chemotaxis protein CheW [Clostridium beijerinckii]MDK2828348.1 purine-binding chemotaxis protein CheW [Clostridium butyricum]
MEEQFVVFHLGKEEYAVQISQVKEIINYTEPTRMPASTDGMLGVINLRGKIVSIIDLGEKIGTGSQKELKDKKIIIIDNGNESYGVIVDEVTEVIKLNKEHIEKVDSQIIKGNKYITGIAKKENRLMIIIDLNLLTGEDVL